MLRKGYENQPTGIQFMEGRIQLSKAQLASELNAQSASKRPKSRHQDRVAILGAHRDVPLRQDVVAIGYRLPVAQPKPGEGLPDSHMEVGVHLVERFPVAVQT